MKELKTEQLDQVGGGNSGQGYPSFPVLPDAREIERLLEELRRQQEHQQQY